MRTPWSIKIKFRSPKLIQLHRFLIGHTRGSSHWFSLTRYSSTNTAHSEFVTEINTFQCQTVTLTHFQNNPATGLSLSRSKQMVGAQPWWQGMLCLQSHSQAQEETEAVMPRGCSSPQHSSTWKSGRWPQQWTQLLMRILQHLCFSSPNPALAPSFACLGNKVKTTGDRLCATVWTHSEE